MSVEKVVDFSVLRGLVITKITGLATGCDVVNITTECGRRFQMRHDQDCCEWVGITEVVGDESDLILSPVLLAEKRTNVGGDPAPKHQPNSWTWTFYELATNLGSVTIRWLGESSGYYSEGVNFYEFTD